MVSARFGMQKTGRGFKKNKDLLSGMVQAGPQAHLERAHAGRKRGVGTRRRWQCSDDEKHQLAIMGLTALASGLHVGTFFHEELYTDQDKKLISSRGAKALLSMTPGRQRPETAHARTVKQEWRDRRTGQGKGTACSAERGQRTAARSP